MARGYLSTLGRQIRQRLRPPDILAHVDEPSETKIETNLRRLILRGWAVARGGEPVLLRVLSEEQLLVEHPCDQARGDVFDRFKRRFHLREPFCGFELTLDLFEIMSSSSIALTLEFEAPLTPTNALTRLGPYEIRLAPNLPFGRGEYKEVWNSGTDSVDHARLVIAGHLDDGMWRATAQATAQVLEQTVAIGSSDTVLEIGCGIGRVGEVLAGKCRQWIGADVSEQMLGHLTRRLADKPTVRTVALNGYDLRNIESESVDVVYSTVVFPHLEDWERFRYVKEGMRVLRPGGRMLIDNYNILSDLGWQIFLSNEEYYHPRVRPPSVGRGSTPQELEAYLSRAGFQEVQTLSIDPCVYVWGNKPNS